VISWGLSLLPAIALCGFLDNFYTSIFGMVLLALILQTSITIPAYFLLDGVVSRFQKKPLNMGIALALVFAIIAYIVYMVNIAAGFPSLFDPSFYLLDSGRLAYFVLGVLLAFPASLWLVSFLTQKSFGKTGFANFLNQNLAGLTISSLFFWLYLILASIFSQPEFDVDDIFFDADTLLWRRRFATEHITDYYWRPVHPFVLIIVRPLVWLVSLFLKGNTLYAAFVLNAFMGALCVFIVWYLAKRWIGNTLYAMLIAVLFGASTAQLIFSSLIETYIYLAAVALFFILLLVTDKPLYMQVITGLVAFGITISNLAQTFIAHLIIKQDIKRIIIYGLIVMIMVVPLTLLNEVAYPESHPYFWDLKSYEGEGHNQFPPTLERANLFARVMFLHSFIAPEPLLLEEEIVFLKVWMFRASIKKEPMQISRYVTDLSRALVTVWMIFVALGGLLFLKNIRKQDNRFSLTFILILLFNFALHMRYGKDVFLYSVNWTYAIVLFLALAWKELADKRWFQLALLVFVALMMMNNSQLIFTMLTTSALHIK
jgi:hypothetical protein